MNKDKRKKFVKRQVAQQTIPYRLVIYIIRKILSFFLWTNKVIIKDKDNFMKQEKSFLLFWHNRLVIVPYFIPKKILKKSYAIASPSKDGQIVRDFLQQWGIKVIRGSHNKNSAILATRKLIKLSNKSSNGVAIVAIAIDGPTGPKYKFKDGLIRMLGHLENTSIYLMSINHTKYYSLKTWDNLQIIKPFGKTTCIIERAFDDNFKINTENQHEAKEILIKKIMAITKD